MIFCIRKKGMCIFYILFAYYSAYSAYYSAYSVYEKGYVHILHIICILSCIFKFKFCIL